MDSRQRSGGILQRYIAKQSSKPLTSIDDELDRYLSQAQCNYENTIEWWLGHRHDFPNLYRFALDILAIPAMAADCERAFSTAKLTLRLNRSRLNSERFERMQLLKQWDERAVLDLA